MRIKYALTLFAFLLASVHSMPLYCEEIKKIESFLYSIHAYDGRIYRSTFSREGAPAIYLLENTDNFLSARKSFVYYFPAMEGYRLDTDLLNFPFTGTLEISGSGISIKLQSEVYTYTNMPEERATDQTSGISAIGDDVANSREGILRVHRGDAAHKVWNRYEILLEEYRLAEEKWQQGAREFQIWQKTMVQKIREARAAGKDVSGLVSEVQTQHYPYPPQKPSYTVEPLLEAYVINLPMGVYRIRLKDEEGYILEGSEKELLVFKEKRSGGVLYQYASTDKITKPGLSTEGNSVIYIDGTNDLYIQGYFQNEYNEFLHNKLAQNDSAGSVFRVKSSTSDKVTDSWLEVERPGKKTEILLEELYYIQVDSSENTGYGIVVWDGRPNQPMQYVNPNFSGFHLPVSEIQGYARISLRNIQDKVYKGSGREVRIVRKTFLLAFIYILATSPLGIMAAILVRRQKLYSKTE